MHHMLEVAQLPRDPCTGQHTHGDAEVRCSIAHIFDGLSHGHRNYNPPEEIPSPIWRCRDNILVMWQSVIRKQTHMEGRCMKGMYTCKICGREFPLMAEEHYTTKSPLKTGLAAVAGGTEKLHDAFDCPHCGCQNIVGEREQFYCEDCELLCGFCDDDEDTEDGESKEE